MRALDEALDRWMLEQQDPRRAKLAAEMTHWTPTQYDRPYLNTLQVGGMLGVPVASDVAGVLGDLQMYRERPEERNWWNYAMTGLGALPFVPAIAGTTSKGAKVSQLHRFTRSDKPESRAGYMLFADDPEAVSHYGPYHWITTDKDAVPASQLITAIERALRKHPGVLADLQTSAKRLASEFDPKSIVDSAGGWDNEDLVEIIWNEVLEPKGIKAVRTADGLISFDRPSVKLWDR
jgi:hypothetical protein